MNKELQQKVYQQHKNTEEDIVKIIISYQTEIDEYNDKFWKEECCTPTIFDPAGEVIKMGQAFHDKYHSQKKKFDSNELIRRIMKMKQRKPKDENKNN